MPLICNAPPEIPFATERYDDYKLQTILLRREGTEIIVLAHRFAETGEFSDLFGVRSTPERTQVKRWQGAYIEQVPLEQGAYGIIRTEKKSILIAHDLQNAQNAILHGSILADLRALSANKMESGEEIFSVLYNTFPVEYDARFTVIPNVHKNVTRIEAYLSAYNL